MFRSAWRAFSRRPKSSSPGTGGAGAARRQAKADTAGAEHDAAGAGSVGASFSASGSVGGPGRGGRGGFSWNASGGGGRGGRRQRIHVHFDGSLPGYVLVAILAASAGYGIGRQEAMQQRPAKGKQQPSQSSSAPSPTVVPAFGPDAVQPYVPAASPSGTPPTLPILTTLSAAEVASHPLLAAIAPYGLPQLPFTPVAGSSDAPPDFHLTPPLFLRHAFMYAFNPRTRNADWCIEMLTNDGASESGRIDANSNGNGSAGSASRDHSAFKPDPLISPAFQASTAVYRGSGFDRGHLVPAADSAHAAPGVDAQSAMDESFFLSNISPQQPAFNRGYWLQVEHHMRKLARKAPAGSKLFVVTGPLWIPTNANDAAAATATATGAAVSSPSSSSSSSVQLAQPMKNNSEDSSSSSNGTRTQLRADVLGSGVPGSAFVTVPTHFFKVVLLAPGESSSPSSSSSSPLPLQLGAFIIPNAPVPLSTPLRSFQVPLEHVESYIGWHLFARVPRRGNQGKRSAAGAGSKLFDALLPTSASGSAPVPLPPVRDLCAAGGCDLKVKDFHFPPRKAHQ